jgi:hypothetical protein
VYVIDTRHYLNTKGAIEPEQGPARKMADFVTAVIGDAVRAACRHWLQADARDIQNFRCTFAAGRCAA